MNDDDRIVQEWYRRLPAEDRQDIQARLRLVIRTQPWWVPDRVWGALVSRVIQVEVWPSNEKTLEEA